MKSASKLKPELFHREDAKFAKGIVNLSCIPIIFTLRTSRLRGKKMFFLLMLFFLLGFFRGGWASTEGLFSTVPAKDATYSKLSQLAKAGLLAPDEVTAPLTRYDVVERILKAQKKYDGIVLAQADMEIPPPPEEGAPASSSSSTDQTAASGAAAPSGPPATEADDDASLAKAAENLHSLQEVYQSELTKVKDRVKALGEKMDTVEADEYALRKRIKGITQFPSISVHGTGRAFGFSQQFWGNNPSYIITPGTRTTFGYLDMGPSGRVTREIGWEAIFRFETGLGSNIPLNLTVRRASMKFNPDWISATLGDFDESYSPLVLWNRNTLDLGWAPEMWARADDYSKYESLFDKEPYWPLRGLKMGTEMKWPDSNIVEDLKTSVFVHMIKNGFSDTGAKTSWYFGPNQYTDWAFGGNLSLKSPRWYMGGNSINLNLDTYGLWLIEPLDSTQPGSPYGAFNPGTWAHQYLIGSLKPDLKIGFGGDFFAGGTLEYALTHYIDDELDSRRVVNDFALVGGPYVQFGDSKINFNYVNVGPYYYSPMAQTRQDAVTDLSNPAALSFQRSPDLFTPALRQYFLQNIPRAGEIYSFYDRTQDNTFPYGLGTPNRLGGGVELDVKTLKEKALKIRGSAYLLQEISGNLVVNSGGSAYVPVDTPPATTLVPVRNFTYVNMGPSLNLGPLIGWDRVLEIGTNARYEQTTSVLGTLTSTWIMGGVKVGFLPSWELSGAFSQQDVNGSDAGYGGTLWARYPYIFDNKDLGKYTTFTVKGSVQSLRFSSVFKVNRNSSIFVDWDWTTGNLLPVNPAQGTVNNHFMELSYEVKF